MTQQQDGGQLGATCSGKEGGRTGSLWRANRREGQKTVQYEYSLAG